MHLTLICKDRWAELSSHTRALNLAASWSDIHHLNLRLPTALCCSWNIHWQHAQEQNRFSLYVSLQASLIFSPYCLSDRNIYRIQTDTYLPSYIQKHSYIWGCLILETGLCFTYPHLIFACILVRSLLVCFIYMLLRQTQHVPCPQQKAPSEATVISFWEIFALQVLTYSFLLQ